MFVAKYRNTRRRFFGRFFVVLGEISMMLQGGNKYRQGRRTVRRDDDRQTNAASGQHHGSARDLAEHATTVVWTSDLQGVCTCIHSDVPDKFPEQGMFAQTDWLESIHPEDRVRLGPRFQEAREKRVRYQFEYRVIKRDGSIRWLRSSAVPRFNEIGEFLGYAGAITESTELRETVLELAKSELALRLVMEHSTDLISHHAPDTGDYLYVSPSSQVLLGFKPDELLGVSAYSLIHPDDAHLVRAEVARQASRDIDSKLVEFRIRHKAGHYVWLGAKIRVQRDPLTEEKLGSMVVARDIGTERREREALIRSEERFRSLANLSSDWYWETDAEGRFTYVSDGLYRLFGASPGEVIGRTRIDRAADTTQAGLLEYLKALEERRVFRDIRYSVYVQSKGTVRHSAISGEPVFEDGQFKGYRGVGRDITEQILAEKRLEQLATHDSLTGLANRAHMQERLQRMLENSQLESQVAVLFIDLDRFKEVNDTLGHSPGDILLAEVARRLRKNLRPDDLVARLGGDEFVVAIPCPQGAESARMLVEKLSSALSEPMVIAGHEVFVRASVGISMYPDDAKSKEALLQAADIAMYRAKEAGRNSYRFFNQAMSEQMKGRMTIENSLHRALERKEFELHYQPRVNLSTLQVAGFEALIRWNHPQLGRIAPLEFIPIAEERGFIAEIGKWVLDEACCQAQRIIDATGKPIRISVNLSARQLAGEQLLDDVRNALDRSGLRADLLELELTETALVNDIDASTRIFQALKGLGVSLAVDDFGTGYSGLAYLGQFPIDVLKLDRSFVNQKNRDKTGNMRVIEAFIEMAHRLGIPVVAEGVETADTLAFLIACRCDEAQGYYFAPPLPAQEVAGFLERFSGDAPAIEPNTCITP